MRKSEKGFSIVELLLVVAVVGLIAVVIWLFVGRQNSETANDARHPEQTQTDTQEKSTRVGIGNLTAQLPTGWSEDSKICSKDTYVCYTKSANDKTYLLAFMYRDVASNGTVGLTIDESINGYDDNSVVKTVRTTKGTSLYVIKSLDPAGKGILVASSSLPNPTNTSLPYGDYKLGIRLEVVGQQSSLPIDFTTDKVSMIVDDFIEVVQSLNL